MNNVLFLKSSILGNYSASSQLVDHAIEVWKQTNPSDKITLRDLTKNPVPMLDEELVGMLAPEEGTILTERQQSAQALSDELINELKNSDVIIIGSPMYNFTISTQFKNYIDSISRNGVSFRYTESGPEGLINNKKVLIIVANGGIYGDTHSIYSHLKQAFGLLGMTDITFISSEGQGYGDEVKNKSIAEAKDKINHFITGK